MRRAVSAVAADASVATTVAAIVALCSACIDFGVPPTPGSDGAALGSGDASDAGADGDADGSSACVEGPVDPLLAHYTLHIMDFQLDQQVLMVEAGDVVAWANNDDRYHHLVAGEPGNPIPPDQGGFDTAQLSSGSFYAHRFCSPRTLHYHCANHSGTMKNFQLVIQ